MKTTLIVLFTLVVSVIAKKIHRIPKGKERKKLRGVTFKKKRSTQRGSGSCPVNSNGDPCADSQANIGVDSCTGEYACDSTDGNIGARSCQGPHSCFQWSLTVASIGDNSCHDMGSCAYFDGTIGGESCHGVDSCYHHTGAIGHDSCIGERSCFDIEGTVGDHSCTSDNACEFFRGDIPSYCPSVAAMNDGLCDRIPLNEVCDRFAPRCEDGLSCDFTNYIFNGYLANPTYIYHCRDIRVQENSVCRQQDKNLGAGFSNPEECMAAARSDSECTGKEIMWSDAYSYSSSNWGCRCCSESLDCYSSWSVYPSNSYWDVYRYEDCP